MATALFLSVCPFWTRGANFRRYKLRFWGSMSQHLCYPLPSGCSLVSRGRQGPGLLVDVIPSLLFLVLSLGLQILCLLSTASTTEPHSQL